MDLDTFTAKDVQLWGPEGEVPVIGISFVNEIDGRQIYQVSFPSQETNGRYRLSIGPDIAGLDGRLLDQDYDGSGGEAVDDVYEGTFTIDTVGPRITRHSPTGDNAGTVEYAEVWFSEAIIADSFTLDDVSITGPEGSITPTELAAIGNNAYRINFDAQTTYGQYHMLVGPNITDLVGNLMDQDRDGVQGEPDDGEPYDDDDVYDGPYNLVDVDLTLFDVSVTETELWAGESIHVSWKGKNESGSELYGDWTDAVYFSDDDQWDIDDVLLKTVDHTGGLAEGASYRVPEQPGETLELFLPGALPGDYHIIIRADLHNQEKEEGEIVADNIWPVGPLPLDVHESTTDGAAQSGTLTKTDRSDYYAINTDGGEGFAVALSGLDAGADAQFYVSYETVPTQVDYDHRSTIIPATLPGTYYVLVYGDQLGEDESTPYELRASTSDLLLADVSPRQHANVSVCTMTITGGGFDQDTTVEFLGSDGSTVRTPTEFEIISSTTMIVKLDLTVPAPDDWPVDVYDVIVAKPDVAPPVDPSTLEDVFQVTLGGEANLDTRLVVPNMMGYHWAATIWIEYTNNGEASMPAPLYKLHGTDNAILTPDQSLAGGGLRTDTLPAGTGDTIQVMATGSGATPGILQPGDSGCIPVYYLGEQIPWGDRTLEFDLGVLTTDSAESIDWATLKDDMQPEWMPTDAWDAIWANLTDQIGDTWGDYVAVLDENMNYLHLVGQDISDVNSLLAFEIQQATGMGPSSYLAGAVDAYSPALGLPLVFGRIYGQSIDARYELGPVGRGWLHNWDIYVQELSDGDVMIHASGGADRFFHRSGEDTFTASSGDYGTLTFSDGTYRLTEKHGTVWQFRSDNFLDYVEDTNGNQITAGYTSGRLENLTHSNGGQLLLDYDDNGRIWHVADTRGEGTEDDLVTTFAYDDSGEYLLTVSTPGDRITTYTYESAGTPQQAHALRRVEYPDGTHDHFVYDIQGRLAETYRDDENVEHDEDGEGVTRFEPVTYSYDSAGTVIVEDATGRQTVLYFGVGGQLVKACDDEGNAIGLGYDHDYQLTGLTGGSGQKYSYSYDSQGNLIDIEDPVRNDTIFTYTPTFNDLASVTDARGNGMQYDYDEAAGNLLSITYEDDTRETFTYWPDGTLHTWTNRRGNATPDPNDHTITYQYQYLTDGRLQELQKSDSSGAAFTYTYSYGDFENVVTVTDQGATVTMTLRYDSQTDWLERIEYPGGRFFTFNYDDAGRRTQRTDQDGNVVNYIYDTVGRLDQMTDGVDALIVDYDYDAAGRLELKTLGNDVYTTYDYDEAGRLIELVNYAPAEPDDTVISSFQYTYDASGRRTSMTTLDGTYTYDYDPLGQLISVTYPDSRVVEYVYDAVGNRIEVLDDAVSTTYDTNAMNQYDQVGEVSYEYDDDGNMVGKTEGDVTTTYTYDIENRLVEVSTPTDTWTYTYDALGNRIESTHNDETTTYIVDPIGLGDVAAEYDDAGNLIARYDHGFGLLARTDATEAGAYYTFDAIGSTSELTSNTGTVLNSYAYDPFGISLSQSGDVPSPFQYVGEYGVMDETNGLQFMRARFYDSVMGRFVSEDPIRLAGGDINTYRYVHGSPVNLTDPSGQLIPWEWKAEFLLRYVLVHGKYGGMYRNAVRDGVDEDSDEYKDLPRQQRAYVRHDQRLHRIKEDSGSECWDLLNPDVRIAHALLILSSWENFLRYLSNTYDLPDPPAQPAGNNSSRIVQMTDPNDKLAPAGYGDAQFIREDDLLAYKIRFENVEDATAPAHIITVTDTLHDHLDLSTFELTEIGFAGHTIMVPEGLSHYETAADLVVDNEFITQTEIRVQIDLVLDTSTRQLTLTMTGLDPQTGWLPEDIMLGILYPNNDTGRGDGHISYNVKPKDGLTTGTEITNKASIVFDWNDPIETPLVRNTIDALPPTSQVAPLPGNTPYTAFIVEWAGEDDPGGSGLRHCDIHVSDNGGEYVPWLEDTMSTSAIYVGQPGHTYAFYSVATDNVGHEQAVPSEPDAETTLTETAGTPIFAHHIFYNNSAFDTVGGKTDDCAIAPGKGVLLPGETATLANYTSYVGGINGIMIDIAGLPAGEEPIDPANYFTFKTGNDDTPTGWDSYLATLDVTIRPGEGVDGSDRIVVTWPDYDPDSPETTAVAGQWLQVTVLANEHTGLAEPNVFYFGNTIGETGDSTVHARVDANDILQTRNNPHPFFDPADIYCEYDFNRDGRVDTHDIVVARNHQTTFFDELALITVPPVGGRKSLPGFAGDSPGSAAMLRAGRGEVESERAAHDAVFERPAEQASRGWRPSHAELTWLYEFEASGVRTRPDKEAGATVRAVDLLLATCRR